MVCYKNGGAIRAAEKSADRTWADVDAALAGPPPEGGDVLFFRFDLPEIAPGPLKPCQRAFRVEVGGKWLEVDPAQLSWEQRVRGVFFSRVLSIRGQLKAMGTNISRVILTGGGSQSAAIQAVFAALLQVPV
eukprot:CAMPEP_0202091670 /NCGR_PEP_ID=MMETSP0964-20121228/46631_1 /ASSEMBLY_ACC=CAM_ASM_000500 /TAXON_ID=4773 /ORGANISM="Schizochytrium aggregatum, Strain ATCC28209" /LENGTH=131 /DNA_ID=CAMNT_0048659877 /DNA_START=18 /DNA_END=410 /DNA_ORIENTATION=-